MLLIVEVIFRAKMLWFGREDLLLFLFVAIVTFFYQINLSLLCFLYCTALNTFTLITLSTFSWLFFCTFTKGALCNFLRLGN